MEVREEEEEEEGTEDIGRCRRGGDRAQRYHFGRGRDGLLLAFCLLQWLGSIHLVYSIRRRYNGIPQNGDNDNQVRSRALCG